ncbi:hypothetical protein F5050DRAFT_1781989 [Lentinula boryana]|uniref:Uncharacterized protein n=1 Tax=Lentinula boryana TaxID=40481 RepID=A0ABQ8Q3Y9_9AGAR|nr:hypothetical protein F5050DRAFT_1781989 [Lentinula boryana]
MRPFSSITNLFSAVLPFLLLDVLDYKANASPTSSLSETTTLSSSSQLNGRGQQLVSRITIGYAYWQDETKCQEYNNEALNDLFSSRSRTSFVLSPVPKYDAAKLADAQDGSCECIFEGNEFQLLDSPMQYSTFRSNNRFVIFFYKRRNRIPQMLLTRFNTEKLHIRVVCKMQCKEIISFTSLFLFFSICFFISHSAHQRNPCFPNLLLNFAQMCYLIPLGLSRLNSMLFYSGGSRNH